MRLFVNRKAAENYKRIISEVIPLLKLRSPFGNSAVRK